MTCDAFEACHAAPQNGRRFLTDLNGPSGDSHPPESRHRLPLWVYYSHQASTVECIEAQGLNIAFVTEGGCDVWHNFGHTTVRAGHVVTVPRGFRFWRVPQGFVSSVTLIGDQHFMRQQTTWLPDFHPMRAELEAVFGEEGGLRILDIGEINMQRIRPRLLRLSEIRASQSTLLTLFARTCEVLEEMASFLHRPFSPSAGYHRRDSSLRPEVRTAIDVVRNDLARPWTVADIARAVALSPSQLTRLFMREVGMGPSTFLWNLRTEKMAELLTTEKLPVAEAAHRTGWTSVPAASRAFKRRFEIPPSVFAGMRRLQT